MVELPTGATSCVLKDVFVPANDQGPRRDPRAKGNDRRLLGALAQFGSGGARFTQWKDATGLPRSTFKDALKRLSAENRVTLKNKVYFLSEAGPEAETEPEDALSATA